MAAPAGPAEELRTAFWGIPAGLPRLDGTQTVRDDARVPGRRALECGAALRTLLDSHDVARFRTVSGSRERQLVGIALQMTTPGVPMVFAGDEIGLEGDGARTRAGRCPGRGRTRGTRRSSPSTGG